MTAELAGRAAVEGVFATVRRLKEQWVTLVFLAGALFWARDTYDEFAKLPMLVRQQMEGLGALKTTVTRLEAEVVKRLQAGDGPAFAFPGNRDSVADGRPGTWTVLHLRPVTRLRADCVPGRLDAFMVDAEGRWFSVETALAPMPALEGKADVAFNVRIPPPMAPGRAKAQVQVTSRCGAERQVDTSPWLPFRVIGG